MTVYYDEYDEDDFFEEMLDSGYGLTPVPESLTIHWSGNDYYFDNVFDSSSLIWIDLMQMTFNEVLPGYGWTVDDPGTIYATENNDDDYDGEDSPFDMVKMQEATDLSLARFAKVFERLLNVGVTVEIV